MPNHNILELLHDDHERVFDLFESARRANDDELLEIAAIICEELRMHSELEELVFYGYLREATTEELLLIEAAVEHEAAKRLIEEIETSGDPVYTRAVLGVLSDYVAHHVRIEEQHLFPLVEEIGVDLDALGLELEERRAAMLGAASSY